MYFQADRVKVEQRFIEDVGYGAAAALPTLNAVLKKKSTRLDHYGAEKSEQNKKRGLDLSLQLR